MEVHAVYEARPVLFINVPLLASMIKWSPALRGFLYFTSFPTYEVSVTGRATNPVL